MTGIPAEENSLHNYQNKQKNRQIINARSLSLELAKQKHRLAAQLVSFDCVCNKKFECRISSQIQKLKWECAIRRTADRNRLRICEWKMRQSSAIVIAIERSAFERIFVIECRGPLISSVAWCRCRPVRLLFIIRINFDRILALWCVAVWPATGLTPPIQNAISMIHNDRSSANRVWYQLSLTSAHPFFPCRHEKVRPHKPIRHRLTNASNPPHKQHKPLIEQKFIRAKIGHHCNGQLHQSKVNKPFTAMTNSLSR